MTTTTQADEATHVRGLMLRITEKLLLFLSGGLERLDEDHQLLQLPESTRL